MCRKHLKIFWGLLVTIGEDMQDNKIFVWEEAIVEFTLGLLEKQATKLIFILIQAEFLFDDWLLNEVNVKW